MVTPIDDDTAVLFPPQESDDGLAAEIAKAAPRRWWNRGTIGLGVAALLLAGFLGGLQAQKHWGTSATTTATARPGGAQAGRGYFGSFPQAPAATPSAAGPTTGKVKLVDGATLYVETADGTVVTVRTSGDTAVRTATAGKLKDVKAGDTVSVQGPAGADGTVTATTVTRNKG